MEMQRAYAGGHGPRRTIASYTDYTSAQRVVDYLSDQRFPVERTAIVAEGLRFVEQVTGRLDYGQAALAGAMSGATTGAFVGFLIGLFSLVTPLLTAVNLALWGLVLGAVIGALIGLIRYALSRGQRDFSSVGGLSAERYNVMVDVEIADDAERRLTQFNALPA